LKYARFILILAGIVLAVSGCYHTSVIRANLDEEFTLSIGQQVIIRGENLRVTFTSVSEDSRCPASVNCIQEGQVVCSILITHDDSSTSATLIQGGLTDKYAIETVGGYILSYNLTPYPQDEQPIPSGLYRLHMVITRLPELSSIVGSILDSPQDYAGQSVTIVGYYRGWDLLQEAVTVSPVTRSDWVIKDLTGAIYVSAGHDSRVPDGLDPSSKDDTEAILRIRGIADITGDGVPFIQAVDIDRLY
jgi:hypothetical protein